MPSQKIFWPAKKNAIGASTCIGREIQCLPYVYAYVTRDIWHMEGGEHSLKMAGPYLIRFWSENVLKI